MDLLRNRQFWVAVLALMQTIVLNYLGVPAEIWASIDAILVIVIGVYTVEQVAMIQAESKREIAVIYSDALNRTGKTVATEIANAYHKSQEVVETGKPLSTNRDPGKTVKKN